MIANSARCVVVVSLLLSVAMAPPVRAQGTSDNALAVKVAAVTLPIGGSADAIVTIRIDPGYGMLASPPPTHWTTGASLAVVSAGGVVAKTPVFPAPQTIQDPDGGRPYVHWTGTVEVRVPLEATAKATPGDKILHGRLRFQLDFESSFYKVRTRDIEIPVKVVKAKKGSAAAAAPATRP